METATKRSRNNNRDLEENKKKQNKKVDYILYIYILYKRTIKNNIVNGNFEIAHGKVWIN